MSQRVYLHVGRPQDRHHVPAGLADRRTARTCARPVCSTPAARSGCSSPPSTCAAPTRRGAASASEVDGAWDTLCRKAREHDGITVISHELLAAASARQVTAALTMLKGLEVHVVVTARDPARQAAAEWQEGIKHGRRLTLRAVPAAGARRRLRDRLRAPLPRLPGPARTCSPAGAPPCRRRACTSSAARRRTPTRSCCGERFGDVVGFDAGRFEPAGPDSANPSLGTVEIDLLRRVNVALDKRLVQPEYGQVVKQLYAQELLAGAQSPRAVVPARHVRRPRRRRRAVGQGDRQGGVRRARRPGLAGARRARRGRSRTPTTCIRATRLDSAVAATAELLARGAAGPGRRGPARGRERQAPQEAQAAQAAAARAATDRA